MADGKKGEDRRSIINFLVFFLLGPFFYIMKKISDTNEVFEEEESD